MVRTQHLQYDGCHYTACMSDLLNWTTAHRLEPAMSQVTCNTVYNIINDIQSYYSAHVNEVSHVGLLSCSSVIANSITLSRCSTTHVMLVDCLSHPCLVSVTQSVVCRRPTAFHRLTQVLFYCSTI